MHYKSKREKLKVARRIMFRREELGLSREQLALNIGISKSHMHDIEYAHKGVSVSTLIKFSEELKVPTDYLLLNTNKYFEEDSQIDELRQRIADYLCDCNIRELEYAEKMLHVLVDTYRECRPKVKNI